jgi:hypothetical protein
MPLIERRSFLTGFMGGLVTAPLVARADSLMKIRGMVMPSVYHRWLTHYNICTDQMMVRHDVANRPLPPPDFLELVPEYLQRMQYAKYQDQIAYMEREVASSIGFRQLCLYSNVDYAYFVEADQC